MPMLTKEEAIEEVCSIVSLAYHSIGDHSHPSDGFCKECDKIAALVGNRFENNGEAIDYVRRAVMNQLLADGFKIDKNFDPTTGKPKKE